jgi:uncharacterized protein YndB with AHSA1/START domain
MTDEHDAPEAETRSIELEQEVAAPPDEVWEVLTTGEGLKSWFPLDARVTPGVGGSVWLSWGPGMEGQAPIHVWEPSKRFGWTESHGEDAAGRPIVVTVDFHVEGRAGTTVVRLVQSGIGASSDWDAMYDSLKDGWTYFLFNLAYYLLKHRGASRKMVWRRVATDLARDVAWDKLVAGGLVAIAPAGADGVQIELDQARPAQVASTRTGHHFAATLPDLDDSVFFVELEGSHIGFWLSTYGVDDDRVAELQQALDERVEGALGSG